MKTPHPLLGIQGFDQLRVPRRNLRSSATLKHSLAPIIFLLGAITGLFLPTGAARSAITPAGTQITSRSRAEYLTNAGMRVAFSNQVATNVLPLYAISLTPPGTVVSPAFSVQGFGGDTLYADFILENLGNAPDSVAVAEQIIPPSTVGLARVILFNDANANGRFETGEDDPAFLAARARRPGRPVRRVRIGERRSG
ncbi:MAG: hypothetical protein V3V49_04520 [Candidatus Krumholzibacteria bacterium]